MVEVVRKSRFVMFKEVKDGEFFLFCDNLYFKFPFQEGEGDYCNAYCFEVDDDHYTFFEDNEIINPVNVKIMVEG